MPQFYKNSGLEFKNNKVYIERLELDSNLVLLENSDGIYILKPKLNNLNIILPNNPEKGTWFIFKNLEYLTYTLNIKEQENGFVIVKLNIQNSTPQISLVYDGYEWHGV